MRIGILTTSYPRHPLDPAGRFVAELAGWLCNQGEVIDVLAPYPARSEHPRVEVHSLRYALRPRLLYASGAPDNIQHITSWPQIPIFCARLALSCYLHSRHWQGLISHWLLPCGLVGGLVGRGLPHLAIAHSSDVHLLRQIGSRGLLKASLAGPRTTLVLTSESLRPILHSLAAGAPTATMIERAPVIPMGIHLNPQSPFDKQTFRRRRGLEKKHIVLYLGRLVAVKGVDRLIQAVAPLSHVALVVIGDGPKRRELQQLASRLDASVQFLGQRGGESKIRWLKAADCLALPSLILPDGRTDSAPVVLLEAMAHGLPIIASRVGGIIELIEDNVNGKLVEAGRVEPLRSAIEQLLGDQALQKRLSRAGQKTAADHSWDTIGDRLRSILLRL